MLSRPPVRVGCFGCVATNARLEFSAASLIAQAAVFQTGGMRGQCLDVAYKLLVDHMEAAVANAVGANLSHILFPRGGVCCCP